MNRLTLEDRYIIFKMLYPKKESELDDNASYLVKEQLMDELGIPLHHSRSFYVVGGNYSERQIGFSAIKECFKDKMNNGDL